MSLIVTWIFSASFMWLAKSLFKIYLPFSSWNIFLQTIGVLSFLVAIISVWLTWKTEKDNSLQVAAARKEEKIISSLESQEKLLLEHIARARTFEDLLLNTQKDVDDLRNQIWRLSAQVQQTDTESVMLRKMDLLERKLAHFEKVG
ncbi:hypothetical protein G7B40_040195 [Aetokthonos hydrillicola Thurmond2011]|uniref:Uncharacterized protein n=1 Tax=Aetokthonos hydrillicola Thurmond2011 TaxID=2712845 RepID=A0AAP5MA18_9CYAN|nr:hypothetical protein [Aetokthonos hydrillicola]MBO3459950.1 hypothetical protein [Aetokthonos hydrillicola CCALA 1050]MBW4584069.1 hypothetical protein [Aetokthonos hydrillicola CCALA 1050]MDR9900711.1 hypothetical protein [Aetokthonos hydrillicola Thurmond2011]